MLGLPLDYVCEMYLNSTWVDVTRHVREDSLSIERGAKDEQPQASPGVCRYTLLDGSSHGNGSYNRRNPLGVYFGSLGRGTPVRWRVPLLRDDLSQTVSDGWGVIGGPGDDGADAWANGTSTGGTVADTDWSRSGTVLSHSLPAVPSNRFSELSPGSATQHWVDAELRCTVTCPVQNVTGTGQIATDVIFRAIDADNYVFVRLVFDTDETVQLGAYERIDGAARTLHADTSIGSLSTLTDQTYRLAALIEGQVVRAKVWVDGDPEPLDWQITCTRASVRTGYLGLLSRVSSGNSNSLPLVVSYDDVEVGLPMFTGQVASLEPGSDDDQHRSPTTVVEAGDPLRRSIQGTSPDKSVMRRSFAAPSTLLQTGQAEATADGTVSTFPTTVAALTLVGDITVGDVFRLWRGDVISMAPYKEDQLFEITDIQVSGSDATVVFQPDALEAISIEDTISTYKIAAAADQPIAYWPCDEEFDSQFIASGLSGGEPARTVFDTPDFASINDYLGSGSILKLNNAELSCPVPAYVDTNEAFSISFCLSVADLASETSGGSDIIQFYTDGTAWSWDLQIDDSFGFRLQASTRSGTQLFSDDTLAGTPGESGFVTISLSQATPTTVEYTFGHLTPATTSIGLSGGSDVTSTATGVTTLGRLTGLRVNPGTGYVDVGFGHLSIYDREVLFIERLPALIGYTAETAAIRLLRTGLELGTSTVYMQGKNPTTRLGPQADTNALSVLEEIPESDHGLMFGSRGDHAVAYLSRSTLYNQEPVLSMSYVDKELLPEFRPVDDDLQLRNQWTVNRKGGTSAIRQLDGGPLAADEIGVYDDSSSISLRLDRDVGDHASWLLNLSTVDEYRFPKIVGHHSRLPLQLMFAVDVGRVIEVQSAQEFDLYDDIRQIVVGYSFNGSQQSPRFTWNCAPAEPYDVFEVEHDTLGVIGSETATLDDAIDETETSLSVDVGDDGLWATTSTAYPLPVRLGLSGDEVVTLTAVSGASSPQTFTVTRSTNGVVKAHPAATAVSLARPSRWAL